MSFNLFRRKLLLHIFISTHSLIDSTFFLIRLKDSLKHIRSKINANNSNDHYKILSPEINADVLQQNHGFGEDYSGRIDSVSGMLSNYPPSYVHLSYFISFDP